MHQFTTLTTACLLLALPGCQSTPSASENAGRSASSRPAASTGSAVTDPGSESDEKPAAYINGEPLYFSRLKPALIEASGGEVFTEVLLDVLLREQIARRREVSPDFPGLSDELIEREKALMLETLSDDADEAVRLLRELRSRRGLGEQRFAAMLRRNAMLRLLVRDQVEPSEAAIRQAFEIRHGRRLQARVLVSESADAAARLRRRVLAGESMSDLAFEHSIDTSASAGGLLPPISPLDPSYPQGLRNAMTGLETGQVSDIVAMPRGYAFVRLEKIIPPDTVQLDQVRERITRLVRLRLERMLMQRRLRSLIEEANVVVLEPLLADQWKQQRRELVRPQ